MTKIAAPLAAAVLAFGVLAAPCGTRAGAIDDIIDLDSPMGVFLVPEWIFGAVTATVGSVTRPIPLPILKPRLGCYFTRENLEGVWRRVEVCY
ncbi:MAG: hypothetical protein JO288_10280 [Hyphomicrobiales bacterium]|nr:hypothetical protein [Hyphomicrobiales bacterium]